MFFGVHLLAISWNFSGLELFRWWTGAACQFQPAVFPIILLVNVLVVCHIFVLAKTRFFWVVGGLKPSERYESQLGWWHSQYMEKKKSCSKPPTSFGGCIMSYINPNFFCSSAPILSFWASLVSSKVCPASGKSPVFLAKKSSILADDSSWSILGSLQNKSPFADYLHVFPPATGGCPLVLSSRFADDGT